MNTEILIYSRNTGFSWVRHADGNGVNLTTEEHPDAKHPTLIQAFGAAIRAGHNPTRWADESGVVLPLDHADWWKEMILAGKL